MPLVPSRLIDRYLTLEDLNPFLELFNQHCEIEVSTLGKSVLDREIPVIRIGKGDYKILCWSQMHGNESTTTKMLLDICHEIYTGKKDIAKWAAILDKISLIMVPVLNPDGASAYTRENANAVDLNRDAQHLTQPESKILRALFDTTKPDLCLNLHGQRSIYGLRETGKAAAISFLAPAADVNKTITPERLEAMHMICGMNAILQSEIPGQVGRYDDTYNANCVGDTFTSLGCPTILFEAGQLGLDYNRNNTRELLVMALKGLLYHIAGLQRFGASNVADYQAIPQNEVFYDDLLIKGVVLSSSKDLINIRAQYTEVLQERKIKFVPEVVSYGKNISGIAHQVIDSQSSPIDNSTSKLPNLEDLIKEYLVKNFSR